MTAKKLKSEAIRSLARIVGPEHVSNRDLDCFHYSHDCMSRSLIQKRRGHTPYQPQAIVWPSTAEEVSRLVQWALRRRVPVIAYGGGSGVSGGTVPIQGGLMIDLKRMNQIESINPNKRTAVVQPGIICEHLESQLQAQGFTLGHFPSSIFVATLGGSIAARGAGQLSSKYGTIDDMVDALEVVLPNGEILPLGAKAVPGWPGLDPVPLFLGSEGTLGIITRARVRLHRKAQAARYRAVSFVHLSDALKSIRVIMQAGLRPSVIRLYDPLDSLLLKWAYEGEGSGSILGSMTRPVSAYFSRSLKSLKGKAFAQILARPALVDQILKRIPIDSLLVLGFEGDETVIKAEEKEVLRLCSQVLSRDEGPEIGQHWLAHRYSVSYKMPLLFSEKNFADTIEVAATWNRIEWLYDEMRRAISQSCLVLAHFSHAYPEGCSIYFTLVGRRESVEQELKLYDRVWNDAMEACLSVGGTICHHHGVGILKKKYMPRELGRLLDLFREIKQRLDPLQIMNPGKMGL